MHFQFSFDNIEEAPRKCGAKGEKCYGRHDCCSGLCKSDESYNGVCVDKDGNEIIFLSIF